MKQRMVLALVIAVSSTLAACGGSSNTQRTIPPPPEATPSSITLSLLGRYQTGIFGESAAEITAYHPASQRAFVVNAQKGSLDVLGLSQPSNPILLEELAVTDLMPGATVNSVAVHGDLMALAIEAEVKTNPGMVAIYSLSDPDQIEQLSTVEVGALPDMLVFAPNGRYLLVANEGEPSDDYQIDPEGSVSVIDVADPAEPVARTAGFEDFNDEADALRAAGVRLYGPGATVAQDLEPEYIAVSPDSTTAWVVLQENNALARVDIAEAKVTHINPLGYKDHGQHGNRLDVSDRDGAIKLQLYPGLKGMYQPDSMAAYAVGDEVFLVTANEGDARAWGEDNDAYWGLSDDCSDADPSQGFVEELRVGHLVHPDGFQRRCGDDMPPQLFGLAAGALLDPEVFGYCGATAGDPGECRSDDNLGRLNISWVMGYKKNEDGTPRMYNTAGEADPDGDRLMYEALYAYGGRSFAIWDSQGQLVWDSGDQFESYLASENCLMGPQRNIPCRDYFNSGHNEADAFDSRSDAKGPEPEGLALGRIGARTYAFIGLERMGGIFVYDITNPNDPRMVDYFNTRENWVSDPETNLSIVGDLGPEGITFVPASQSPNGEALLIVGNEVSGTTSILRIDQWFQ